MMRQSKRPRDDDETHDRPPDPLDKSDPPDKSLEHYPNLTKNQIQTFEKYQIYPRHLVILPSDESEDLTDIRCFKIAK